jgi:ribosome-binding factor A
MPDRRGRRAGSPTGAHRYPRTARVNQVLREVVADELERIGDDDSRLGMLTVTGIEVEPDLRNAKVWLTSLGEETAEALEEHRLRIQSAIAGQVRLKRTPHLTFAADPAIAAGMRIEEIIRDLGEDR